MKTLANTDDTIFSSLTLSNGTSFVTLSAPPTGIYILLLPPNLGSPGDVLTTTGSGETYWATAAASNYITSVDSDFLVTGGQLSSPTITDINQRVITTTVPSFLTSAGPVIGASGTIDILLGLGSLPTTHGGTGLKTIGAANTVLTSSGTSVSWAPVSTLVNSNIGAATGISLSLNSVTSVLSAFVTYNISPNNTEVEISYSPTLNLFVSTGRNTPSISTSTDGITWTSRTSPHTNPIYFANIWIPELNLFMIGGIAATPVVATSPDGITWTNRTLPGGGGWVFRGAWNGSLLVCGSQGGFYTSPDAINYTFTAQAFGQKDIVVYSPLLNLFVASGASSIISSPNGTTWTLRYTGNGYTDGDWSPTLGLFVMGGSNITGPTNRIITSPDGIIWTPRTTQDQRISPKWVPALSVFLGTSYSFDGVTWINSGVTLYDGLASSSSVIVSGSGNTMKRTLLNAVLPGGIGASTINATTLNLSTPLGTVSGGTGLSTVGTAGGPIR